MLALHKKSCSVGSSICFLDKNKIPQTIHESAHLAYLYLLHQSFSAVIKLHEGCGFWATTITEGLQRRRGDNLHSIKLWFFSLWMPCLLHLNPFLLFVADTWETLSPSPCPLPSTFSSPMQNGSLLLWISFFSSETFRRYSITKTNGTEPAY